MPIPSFQRHFSRQARIALISVTLASEAVILTTCLWDFAPEIIPPVVFPVKICAAIVAGGAFFVNLTVAALVSGLRSRSLHICLALTFPIVCSLDLWSNRHHVSLRTDWFLREGIGTYEKLVATIESKKFLLSDKRQNLSRFGEAFNRVSACTNKDGSLTVWFKPRENNYRLGYLFSSGGALTADPLDPENPYFYRLTNGWYEF
jgi:hypothetical protein